MKEAKFKIGDKVNHPKDLYGDTSGKIYEVDRCFKKVDENNNFIPDALEITESNIKSGFAVPYKFDGETLTFNMPKDTMKFSNGSKLVTPAHKEIFKPFKWVYSVKSPKMNTLFSERSLRKI